MEFQEKIFLRFPELSSAYKSQTRNFGWSYGSKLQTFKKGTIMGSYSEFSKRNLRMRPNGNWKPSEITPPVTNSRFNRLERKNRRHIIKWTRIEMIISPCQIFKVQILWEGHTIWKKKSPTFFWNYLNSNIKTKWVIFSKFWGLLRISDLYQEDFLIVNCKH